jgi:small subunit ribosomal protein S17
MTETEQGRRKIQEGLVTSSAMDKTVVVEVKRLVRHPRYHRVVRRTSHYKAHDESNECAAGDRVRLMETRPLSKTKRWRVVEVLEKAK